MIKLTVEGSGDDEAAIGRALVWGGARLALIVDGRTFECESKFRSIRRSGQSIEVELFPVETLRPVVSYPVILGVDLAAPESEKQ